MLSEPRTAIAESTKWQPGFYFYGKSLEMPVKMKDEGARYYNWPGSYREGRAFDLKDPQIPSRGMLATLPNFWLLYFFFTAVRLVLELKMLDISCRQGRRAFSE